MVPTAQRHCEFIADFHADRARLRKAQVMRIGGGATADETGLRGHEFQMRFVAQPFGFGDGQLAFVDFFLFGLFSICRRERRCRRIAVCLWFGLRKELAARTVMPPAIIV